MTEMILNPAQIDPRTRQILAGLFLSKFDAQGLDKLGFDGFTEAFNALGYGLGGRPASIKNYRDEFDPLFPNPRQGWRHRKRRDYCMKIEAAYRSLQMSEFAALVSGFVGTAPVDAAKKEADETSTSTFAKRLITGKAAEKYFESACPKVPEFAGHEVEDTTGHGCGYDFRLWPKLGRQFKAVEVKGMAESSGWVSLTDKEYDAAQSLKERFFLFVVKNFHEKPFHEIHGNPISGPLKFTRQERRVIQVSWSAAA